MSADARGYAFVDVLFVTALVGVVLAMAAPNLTAGLDAVRTRAAGRYLTAQMALARTQAAIRSAAVALRFESDAAGVSVSVVADGNGNGVRTREIDEGVDRVVVAPVRLEHLFPGVTIGGPAGSDESAVRLGSSTLLTFTPSGTSTSGTVYLTGRGGSRSAVRVLGATGRVRLLRYESGSGIWLDVF
jgi:Tfp pilus assembly protein FimT